MATFGCNKDAKERRIKPVHLSKEPVFFRITDAYGESLINFRVQISVSVPQAILPIPAFWHERSDNREHIVEGINIDSANISQ